MNFQPYLSIGFISIGVSLATYLFLRIAKSPRVNLSESLLSYRAGDYVFFTLATAYTVVFSTLSVLRHLSFNTDGYDMAIFDQAVWNSLRGRLLETSVLPDVTVLLGQRFSPILLAFVPLYSVWSNPITLMVAQTLAIALGAFPIYWFARGRLGSLPALGVALAYFLSPALEGVNLFEFHEIALSIPLFSFATFFMLRKRYMPCLVCLGLALFVKEDMTFVVTGFGIYLIAVQRRWRLGLGVALAGITSGVLLLQYLIPYFNGSPIGSGQYYYFGAGIAGGRGRYDYLGQSLFEILTTLFTRPLFVLQHVVTFPKIEYVLQLIVPLAFLSLLGAEISALAIPTLAVSLLSDFSPQFSINYHYSASLLPFLFFAATVGMQRIAHWRLDAQSFEGERRRRGVALTVLLLAASGIGYYDLAPGPLARHFDPAQYALTRHSAAGDSLVAMIPPDAVVVAQARITPHLSERPHIYEFPAIINYCKAEYLLADVTQFPYRLYEKNWADWFATGYFQVVAQEDGFLLARRRLPDKKLDVNFEDNVMVQSYTLPVTEKFRGGQFLCPIIRWQTDRADQGRFVLQTQLWDSHGHLIAQDPPDVENGFSAESRRVTVQGILDQLTLNVRSSTPSGVYDVTLSVFDSIAGRYLNARDANGRQLESDIFLSSFQIDKDKSSKSAASQQIEQPFFVDMEEMRLLGFVNRPNSASPGETLALGVYWRARGKPRGDYEVVVRLLDSTNSVAFEQVSRPAAGSYPTTEWDEGEVLLDWHDLNLPAQFPVGDYYLVVELRNMLNKAILGQAPVTHVTVK